MNLLQPHTLCRILQSVFDQYRIITTVDDFIETIHRFIYESLKRDLRQMEATFGAWNSLVVHHPPIINSCSRIAVTWPRLIECIIYKNRSFFRRPHTTGIKCAGTCHVAGRTYCLVWTQHETMFIYKWQFHDCWQLIRIVRSRWSPATMWSLKFYPIYLLAPRYVRAHFQYSVHLCFGYHSDFGLSFPSPAMENYIYWALYNTSHHTEVACHYSHVERYKWRMCCDDFHYAM